MISFPPFAATINPPSMSVDPNACMFSGVPFPQVGMPMQIAPPNSLTTLNKIRLFVPCNVIGAIIGSKVEDFMFYTLKLGSIHTEYDELYGCTYPH